MANTTAIMMTQRAEAASLVRGKIRVLYVGGIDMSLCLSAPSLGRTSSSLYPHSV